MKRFFTVVLFLLAFVACLTAETRARAQALDQCTPVVGTMGAARWKDGYGLKAAGQVRATLGYSCPIYTGRKFSFIGNGFVGTVLDTTAAQDESYKEPSKATESKQALGLTVGLDYETKGQFTAGVAWQLALPADNATSYLIVFKYEIPVETILDLVTDSVTTEEP